MDGAYRHRRNRFARPAPRERFLPAYQGFAKKATPYSHDIHIDTSQNHNVATSAMSSSSHATMRPTLLQGERIPFTRRAPIMARFREKHSVADACNRSRAMMHERLGVRARMRQNARRRNGGIFMPGLRRLPDREVVANRGPA